MTEAKHSQRQWWRCARARTWHGLLLVALLALGAACGGGGGDDGGEDAEAQGTVSAGQQLYIDKGCPACHGQNAEGIADKPRTKLAGTRMIIQQFSQRVRNGKGSAKPAMSTEQITDDEIKTIHEWVRGLPVD